MQNNTNFHCVFEWNLNNCKLRCRINLQISTTDCYVACSSMKNASSDKRSPVVGPEVGTVTRKRVLGDAHVEQASAGMTEFDAPFQDLITDGAWGKVWSRPNLTLRERSMLTIALLAAQGHHEELAMHVRATENTGASAEDISEALLHVAVYAGVPAANSAIKIAKQTLKAMEQATEGTE